MTQEEKHLLLVDLCARLPYEVKVEIDEYNISVLKGIDGDTISTDRGINYPLRLVKPYLRPMSNMTEEEWEDFNNYRGVDGVLMPIANELDWLNEHHFDYRGLIEKGLALEASEGMYE